MTIQVISDYFKVKLGSGGMLVNGGLIAKNAPNNFKFTKPVDDVAFSSPAETKANISYAKPSGLAFSGQGAVENIQGKKTALTKQSNILIGGVDALARIVGTVPSVFTDSAGSYLIDIMQYEVTTDGVATAYVATSYEEVMVSEATYSEAASASEFGSQEESASQSEEKSGANEPAAEESNASNEPTAEESGNRESSESSGGDDSSGGEE